ncbi:MAG: glycosyltransferase family 4 protein [Thermodesulfovibrionales bacterium]|nr:glycosyltransferase family 4 protein [Thermodesulfovibrionales bacterium]
MKDYKIAIVHDWMMTLAGAETVLESIYDSYPSDIFTLICDFNSLKGSDFENAKITTSFLQKMPFVKKHYRKYLALMPFAIEDFDLSGYDVILSSSHAVAKGVLTNAKQLHISYIHTPMRYAWDMYHFYLKEAKLNKSLKGLLAKVILHYIRIWDLQSANRVDYFIANSKYVRKRIYKIYKQDAHVIYPPVNVNAFDYKYKKDNFFLTASRMVPYKKVDLIVSAFAQMPDLRLVVIGDGPEMKKIKALSSKNIEIIGWQSRESLKDYLQRARAFVFAAEEDFGIVPVEAQACGCPVIAYSQGGCLETIIDGKTGVFFHNQTPDAVINAVRDFIKIEDSFNPEVIRQNAELFSIENFKRQYKSFVNEKIERFFNV